MQYQSASKYNPIFEFEYQIGNQPYLLKVTSVSTPPFYIVYTSLFQVLGHVMGYKFPDSCKNWQQTSYDTLYYSNFGIILI